MIHQAIRAAKEAKIEVSLCGEMAGDPLSLILLIGMGINVLSMNPISIPRIKKILRSITHGQAVELLNEALKLKTSDDIEKLIRTKTKHILPGDVQKLHILG